MLVDVDGDYGGFKDVGTEDQGKNEVEMMENRIWTGIKKGIKEIEGASHSAVLTPQEPHAPVKSWPHTKGFS